MQQLDVNGRISYHHFGDRAMGSFFTSRLRVLKAARARHSYDLFARISAALQMAFKQVVIGQLL